MHSPTDISAHTFFLPLPHLAYSTTSSPRTTPASVIAVTRYTPAGHPFNSISAVLTPISCTTEDTKKYRMGNIFKTQMIINS